jgi:hypothetical protein
VRAERFACGDRPGRHEALPRYGRNFQLLRMRSFGSISDRFFDNADVRNHARKVRNLERRTMVRPRQTAVERDVFFDDLGAERYGGD